MADERDDEYMLALDALMWGNEFWTVREDGSRKRVDPLTLGYRPLKAGG